MKARGYGPYGGGKSKHALTAPERWALWSLFRDQRSNDDWFLRQQPGWREFGQSVPGLQDEDPRGWWAVLHSTKARAHLLVRLPDRGIVTAGELAKAVFCLRTEDGQYHALPDIAWARLEESGILRTASHDGVLSEWAPGKRVKSAPPPTARGIDATRRGSLAPTLPSSGWKCRGTYDISSLEPQPGPAPPWAHAPLPKAWLKQMLARATPKDQEAIAAGEVD